MVNGLLFLCGEVTLLVNRNRPDPGDTFPLLNIWGKLYDKDGKIVYQQDFRKKSPPRCEHGRNLAGRPHPLK